MITELFIFSPFYSIYCQRTFLHWLHVLPAAGHLPLPWLISHLQHIMFGILLGLLLNALTVGMASMSAVEYTSVFSLDSSLLTATFTVLSTVLSFLPSLSTHP